ncbi:MAG: bile acid:sodium symporter family protein [Acidobacteria bacterium]|nr:bile acid:sodium symporter family protein [Acidobacteriota bacterium]
MRALVALSNFAGRWFGVVILAAAVGGYFAPNSFLWALPWIGWLLAVIMLGMGTTLTAGDFAAVFTQPRVVAAGVGAQYIVMPLLAWGISRALQLPPELAVGVILVGTCPGGTASNVIAFLARADVALSVTLTTISTLLAPILTPALTLLLVDRSMDVSAAALFLDVFKIVAAPVALGVLLNRYLPGPMRTCKPFLPLTSVTAIALIVAAVVAGNRESLYISGPLIAVAVIAHNGIGLALGYGVGSLMGLSVARRRTTAIEVGMQNSGLAVALARAHFDPVAALPGALFTVWHNLSGALVAARWRQRDFERSLRILDG